jgi:hypothetical protein
MVRDVMGDQDKYKTLIANGRQPSGMRWSPGYVRRSQRPPHCLPYLLCVAARWSHAQRRVGTD